MDSAEVGKYIESVAVRIGFHNGGSLAGTGVLYTLQAQKRAVVLTAGHVLQNDSHICPAVLSVWSKSGTKNISLDLSDSDDNKEVNIHYCPGFMYNGRKYVFDAAIIDVPWHDWMVNIPEIRLGEAKISTQIQLIGYKDNCFVLFPEGLSLGLYSGQTQSLRLHTRRHKYLSHPTGSL